MQDCYAQRVDSAGVSQWAADGVRFRSNARDFDQKIAADGTGGMVATWSTNGGVDKDIFASRISAEGVLPGFWSAAGVPVGSATGDQDHVVLTGDGTGGAIIAWEDRRAAIYPTHVYAQRLDPVARRSGRLTASCSTLTSSVAVPRSVPTAARGHWSSGVTKIT